MTNGLGQGAFGPGQVDHDTDAPVVPDRTPRFRRGDIRGGGCGKIPQQAQQTGTPAAAPAATVSDSAPDAAEAAAPAQRVPDPVKQLKRVRRKARKAEAAVAELEARIAEAEQRPAIRWHGLPA
ncbi:hypothetical protein [Phaeobacter inhibens]|uniref:hypothetical protein n=1 Tax=Phaeobacter inhibens TaxID=221822 RepID=UPI0021A887CA|nr:hypothetical protein [Phaeobacter inhibens]